MRLAGVVPAVVLFWLVIGVLAVWQHGAGREITLSSPDCSGMVTAALTVGAGPLNYLGVHPRVTGCRMPDYAP